MKKTAVWASILAITDSIRADHCRDITKELDPEAAEIAVSYMTSMSDKIAAEVIRYLKAANDFKNVKEEQENGRK